MLANQNEEFQLMELVVLPCKRKFGLFYLQLIYHFLNDSFPLTYPQFKVFVANICVKETLLYNEFFLKRSVTGDLSHDK